LQAHVKELFGCSCWSNRSRADLSRKGVTGIARTPDASSTFRALADMDVTKRALSATTVLKCLRFIEKLIAPELRLKRGSRRRLGET